MLRKVNKWCTLMIMMIVKYDINNNNGSDKVSNEGN